jgi:hypothetical protein
VLLIIAVAIVCNVMGGRWGLNVRSVVIVVVRFVPPDCPLETTFEQLPGGTMPMIGGESGLIPLGSGNIYEGEQMSIVCISVAVCIVLYFAVRLTLRHYFPPDS